MGERTSRCRWRRGSGDARLRCRCCGGAFGLGADLAEESAWSWRRCGDCCRTRSVERHQDGAARCPGADVAGVSPERKREDRNCARAKPPPIKACAVAVRTPSASGTVPAAYWARWHTGRRAAALPERSHLEGSRCGGTRGAPSRRRRVNASGRCERARAGPPITAPLPKGGPGPTGRPALKWRRWLASSLACWLAGTSQSELAS